MCLHGGSRNGYDRYQYGYDRDSNRLWRDNLINTGFGELYAYDNLNQLTSMDRGTLNGTKTGLTGSASRSQDWDYDTLGNWDSVTTDSSTQTRSHNAQNEITSISGATTPTYDSNGNLTKDETGRTFKYDAWNRLVEVKTSGGSTIVTYKYDALNGRVSETKGGNTRDFYYSANWQVLKEKLNGTTDTSYVWSPVYVDAMIARDRDTDANGSLDERLYALYDANFNVTALVNTSGTVVERYAYDSFGNVTVYDASWSVRVGGSNYSWIYLHQGGRWESQTGLYHFRNREYSPTLGRWIQIDPIGFEGGDVNLYRYSVSNPGNLLDPSGLQITLGPDNTQYGVGPAEVSIPAGWRLRVWTDRGVSEQGPWTFDTSVSVPADYGYGLDSSRKYVDVYYSPERAPAARLLPPLPGRGRLRIEFNPDIFVPQVPRQRNPLLPDWFPTGPVPSIIGPVTGPLDPKRPSLVRPLFPKPVPGPVLYPEEPSIAKKSPVKPPPPAVKKQTPPPLKGKGVDGDPLPPKIDLFPDKPPKSRYPFNPGNSPPC
jgi:RHS repeat-associated protein